jgi:hypothetical protein
MPIKLVLIGSAVVTTLMGISASSTGGPLPAALAELSGRFPLFVVTEGADSVPGVVYADAQGHIHGYGFEGGKPALAWETEPLGSRVTSLFVRDIDHDGRPEIVVATESGRITLLDASSHGVVWENSAEPPDSLSCLTAGNLDGDPQDELIFIAGGHLTVLDGRLRSTEWRSDARFEGQSIALANTDDDEQVEVILNTGVIIDSRFHNVEFESAVSFGARIGLLDLTGDGFPEVVGESADGTIRVFDVHGERELW